MRAVHLVELLAAARTGALPTGRRRSRVGIRGRAEVPADEAAALPGHLSDRPQPDSPGAAGAGRPDALDGSAGSDDVHRR